MVEDSQVTQLQLHVLTALLTRLIYGAGKFDVSRYREVGGNGDILTATELETKVCSGNHILGT
jgi:hypothetical protein